MKSQWVMSGVLFCNCILLIGCVSGGNPSIVNQSLVDQIKLDISTKEDVRRILGQPNSMSRHSGNYATPTFPPVAMLTNTESWSYTHIDVAVDGATFIPIVGLFAGGATSNVNTFMVMFDDKGVVRSISSSQSQSQSGMGRAGPINQSVK